MFLIKLFLICGGKLADHYKGKSKVIFGFMNEPNTMPAERFFHGPNQR